MFIIYMRVFSWKHTSVTGYAREVTGILKFHYIVTMESFHRCLPWLVDTFSKWFTGSKKASLTDYPAYCSKEKRALLLPLEISIISLESLTLEVTGRTELYTLSICSYNGWKVRSWRVVVYRKNSKNWKGFSCLNCDSQNWGKYDLSSVFDADR